MNKIILYYQTFKSLKPILQNPKYITHIHLSAIHFGLKNNKPYIHLNDYDPSDKIFNKVWVELEEASQKGIKIILMIGGAGGAFINLFNNFDIYYNLLYKTIKKYPIICGVDLDIEEFVLLDNVKMLINRIDKDFGSKFIISMAPIQYSLENDNPGLGGFIYKKLINSIEGKRINYLNGQFYGSYDLLSYDSVINNGYNDNIIVIGMLSDEYNDTTLDEIKKIKNKYNNFGGVYIWEYNDSPLNFGKSVYNIINKKKSCLRIIYQYFRKICKKIY